MDTTFRTFCSILWKADTALQLTSKLSQLTKNTNTDKVLQTQHNQLARFGFVLGEERLSEKTVKYSHGVYTRSSRFGWLLRASTYSHVWNVLSWTLRLLVWCLRNVKSWNSTFQTVCPVGGYCCSVFGTPELSVMFRLHKQTQVVMFFYNVLSVS